MKKNNLKVFYFFTPVLLLIIVFYFAYNDYLSLQFIKNHFSEFQRFQNESPILVASLYSIIYVIVAALAIPGAAVLTLLGGAMFGVLKGTVIVSFASTIGSTVAFLLSRYLFREKLQQRFHDKLEILNDEILKNGTAYLFFLRLNPIIPFLLINSLMGLTPMKAWNFFRVSQLGMLPGTLLYINAGTQLTQVQSANEIVSWDILVSFLLLGLFPLMIQKFVPKFNNKN